MLIPPVRSPARVLRVPGSYNHKRRPPTRVTLLTDLPDGPEPQSLTWWAHTFLLNPFHPVRYARAVRHSRT